MDHIYSYSKLMVEQTPINKLRAHMEEVKELVTVLKDINFLNFISNLSVSADNKKQLLTQICDKSGLNKFKYIF
jgi:F0F1-type ATP synthase delta subunit